MNKLNFLKNIKFGRPPRGRSFLGCLRLPWLLAAFFCARAGHLLDDHIPARYGSIRLRHGDRGAEWSPPLNERARRLPHLSSKIRHRLSIPDADLPPAWDGASRINILLIGLDYRDWEEGRGAPRSDTMILLTVDPAHKDRRHPFHPARYVGEYSGVWI
jgi:hypothetical protein